MQKEDNIKYWIVSAEHDKLVAKNLFDIGHYDWCLYIGQLVLEKILKALYVRDNDEEAPWTHNLYKLAEKINIILSIEQIDFMDRITTFNMEARYPNKKFDFYKICTKEFANDNLTQILEMYEWLKSQI